MLNKSNIGRYGLMPYEENGMQFVPQLFYKLYTVPFGVQTFQIHLNYFKQKDFEEFEKFIKSNSKKIITYEQAISKLTNNLQHKIIRMVSKKALQLKRSIW